MASAETRPFLRRMVAVLGVGLLISSVGCSADRAPARSDPPDAGDLVVFPPSNTPYGSVASLDEAPWADDLQDEQDACEAHLSQSVETFLTGSCDGEHVNVTHGNRVTRTPAIETGHPVTLWFSGGSAAFGIAQRDDHTIASQLVELAEADGIELHVENLAHVGFDFSQELTYAIEPLLTKGLAPDLLVIYNGFNDAAGEVFTDFLEGVDPNRPDAPLSEVDLDEVNRRAQEFLDEPGEERSALGSTAGRISAERYARLQGELGAIVPSDTQVHYFFQPDALVNVEQIRAAYGQALASPEAISRSPLATALDSMTSELGSRTHDLRPLFEPDGPPAFVGIVHQNEPGASVVAQAIYASLRPALAELSR